MKINPLNVINLLLATFQSLNIQESRINFKEIELSNKIESLLLDAMNEFNDIEMITENTLNFQEEFKDTEAQIIEDEIQHHFSDPPFAPTNECTDDEEDLSFDYKSRAVEFWRSGKKKNLSLETVKKNFKKVNSIRQLRRWAHYLNKGGTYREKISRICQFTLENFKAAVDAGLVIHDEDLRKWALQAQKQIGFEDIRFRASSKWVDRFKKSHRIVSRKINKFITRKTLESTEELEKKQKNLLVMLNKLRKR